MNPPNDGLDGAKRRSGIEADAYVNLLTVTVTSASCFCSTPLLPDFTSSFIGPKAQYPGRRTNGSPCRPKPTRHANLILHAITTVTSPCHPPDLGVSPPESHWRPEAFVRATPAGSRCQLDGRRRLRFSRRTPRSASRSNRDEAAKTMMHRGIKVDMDVTEDRSRDGHALSWPVHCRHE